MRARRSPRHERRVGFPDMNEPKQSREAADWMMARILVVEDEPEALELLRYSLEELGHEVLGAKNAQVALAIGRSFQPDVLITDYFLQDQLNGLDVIEQLRKANPKLRVILVTGLIKNALTEEIRRLHDVPVLTKPFDLKRLKELISGR
jgi:two-component system, response regulator, stage 0 sporulation protein F